RDAEVEDEGRWLCRTRTLCASASPRFTESERWTTCPAVVNDPFRRDAPMWAPCLDVIVCGSGRPRGAAPTCTEIETERWTPCPAGGGGGGRAGRAGGRGAAGAGRERRGMWARVRQPCTNGVVRQRARPAGGRGRVLRPPCIRQRPLAIAGCRQHPPAR